MNVLIADSGVSKTDWVLMGEDTPQFISTEGLNPQLVTAAEFLNILTKELKPNLMGKAVSRIYFYGAGCGTADKKKEVEQYLSEVFEFAEIKVSTDLEGAGLALFGKSEGIVCVLGTGSDAGIYKGGKITSQLPAADYPQGDEGSGSHIGRMLLESYFRGNMSKRLNEYFEGQEKLILKDLFVNLQKPKEAKVYLAHVCKVFEKKSAHPEVQEILFNGFSAFLNRVIEFFPGEVQKHEIGFVGSIASTYEGELRACAKQKGLEVSSVIRSPLEHILLQFNK